MPDTSELATTEQAPALPDEAAIANVAKLRANVALVAEALAIETRTAAPAAKPTPLTLGQRLAADLRTLADLAEQHPEVATYLSRTIDEVCIVLPWTASTGVHDEFAQLLPPLGAETVPSRETLADSDRWRTQSWQLPAGAIELTLTQLQLQPEPVAFDVFARPE